MDSPRPSDILDVMAKVALMYTLAYEQFHPSKYPSRDMAPIVSAIVNAYTLHLLKQLKTPKNSK